MDEDVPALVTKRMALYVHDCLLCPVEEDKIPVFHDLLLKCFGVWLGKEEEAALRLSGPELWMVQSIAKSGAAVGKEKVGMAWLQIVADGLLHLAARAGVHEAVMGQGDGQVAEPKGRQEAEAEMRAWAARQAPGGSGD